MAKYNEIFFGRIDACFFLLLSILELVEKTKKQFRFFVGMNVINLFDYTKQALAFIGNYTLGIFRVIKNRGKFRWLDTFVEMQRRWNSSLLIVSLISFLLGVILAFQSALQLRQYGVGILVADLASLVSDHNHDAALRHLCKCPWNFRRSFYLCHDIEHSCECLLDRDATSCFFHFWKMV